VKTLQAMLEHRTIDLIKDVNANFHDVVLCENSAEAGSVDEEPYSTQFQEVCASQCDPERMAHDRDIRRVLHHVSLSGTLVP